MKLPRLKTGVDLHEYAKARGLQATADLLRAYVEAGQPRWFMPRFTSRALCRIASKAIEGTSDLEDGRQYIDTDHGAKLYFYMWGSDRGPIE